jgi:hypothetical protein
MSVATAEGSSLQKLLIVDVMLSSVALLVVGILQDASTSREADRAK